MNEKTKKKVLAVELASLVIISAFVVSIFYNNSSGDLKNQLPIASISADITSGEAPLEVSFTGIGADKDGTISQYHWDFGDSTISTGRSVKHTFQKAGEYIVVLSLTDDKGGTSKESTKILVEKEPLKARATAGYDYFNPEAPLIVGFWGEATGGEPPYNYHWEFSGGLIREDLRESDEQNPDRIYWSAGYFQAYLTVTDSTGDTAKADTFVNVKDEKLLEYLGDVIRMIFDILGERRSSS